MMHDPNYFPEPDKFKPERFRQKVETLKGNNLLALNGLDKDDPASIVFGFGRRYALSMWRKLTMTYPKATRICPGRYYADTNLWLMMSNILAVFDVGPPLDARGKPQEMGEVKCTHGLTT